MYVKPAEPGDGAFGCKAPVSPVRRQNEQPPLKWTLVLSCIWLMNYWCEPTAASGRGLVGCDLLHATIWSVPHAPEYHTMGGAGVRCLAGSAPTSGIAHTTASPGNKTLLNVVAIGLLKMSFGFRFACYFNLITLEICSQSISCHQRLWHKSSCDVSRLHREQHVWQRDWFVGEISIFLGSLGYDPSSILQAWWITLLEAKWKLYLQEVPIFILWVCLFFQPFSYLFLLLLINERHLRLVFLFGQSLQRISG